MKFVLMNAGDGVDRAEIVAQYYGLDRRYCGYYTDPCYSRRKQHQFDVRSRRAQAAVTKSLDRLEERGLVELIRCRQYVKKVRLTQSGELVANTLKRLT